MNDLNKELSTMQIRYPNHTWSIKGNTYWDIKCERCGGGFCNGDDPCRFGDAAFASEKQRKMIWAKLKSELKLSNADATDFINDVTGQKRYIDLTRKDISDILAAINEFANFEYEDF